MCTGRYNEFLIQSSYHSAVVVIGIVIVVVSYCILYDDNNNTMLSDIAYLRTMIAWHWRRVRYK